MNKTTTTTKKLHEIWNLKQHVHLLFWLCVFVMNNSANNWINQNDSHNWLGSSSISIMNRRQRITHSSTNRIPCECFFFSLSLSSFFFFQLNCFTKVSLIWCYWVKLLLYPRSIIHISSINTKLNYKDGLLLIDC